MKAISGILVVLGVCVGALGATGFHEPAETAGAAQREPFALPLFLLGVAALSVGGLLARRLKRTSRGTADRAEEIRDCAAEIYAIRDCVARLDEEGTSLSPAVVRERIDDLMSGALFDLTSRNDELIRLLGFSAYARVWDGIATAERLLNRCWTMITDGHAEEGLEELPLARAGIERAAREIQTLERTDPG